MSDMSHEKAVAAAYFALVNHTHTVSDGGHTTMEGMSVAIAAFLRAWEPKFGHVWNQASVKVAANHAADELEGKP